MRRVRATQKRLYSEERKRRASGIMSEVTGELKSAEKHKGSRRK
jgi:hypothetical protein